MTRKVWGKWWFWCILAVFAALPLPIMYLFSRVPGSGQVRVIEERLLESGARSLPPVNLPDRYGDVLSAASDMDALPGPIEANAWAPAMALSDEGARLIGCYEQRYGKLLDEYRGLVAACDQSSRSLEPAGTQLGTWHRAADSVSKAHASLAMKAVHDGNWDKAFDHLEQSARAADPLVNLGYSPEMALLISTGCYNRAAGMLKIVLACDPDLTNTLKLKQLATALVGRVPLWTADRLTQTLRSTALETGGDAYKDWKNTKLNVAATQVALVSPSYREMGGDALRIPITRWTRTRATVASIRRILSRDPDAFANRLAALPVLADAQPEIRMLYVNLFAGQVSEIYRTIQETRNRLVLVQTAAAARAHFLENDRWPASVGELVPKYLKFHPEVAGETPTGDPVFPKAPRFATPVHMQTKSVVHQLASLVSAGGQAIADDPNFSPAFDREAEVLGLQISEAASTPLLGYMLADAIQRIEPDLVGKVKVLAGTPVTGQSNLRFFPRDEATSVTLSNLKPRYEACMPQITAPDPKVVGALMTVIDFKQAPQPRFCVFTIGFDARSYYERPQAPEEVLAE